jgi:hypothetical protein
MAAALRRVLPGARAARPRSGCCVPGRMFEGDRYGVEFRPISVARLMEEIPEPFDLVVICDVLDHLAEGERDQLLPDAAALTAPGGTVVVKEWEYRGRASSAVAFGADRWVSGDAGVRFMPRGEIDALIAEAMPGWETTCEALIPPRRANLLLTVRHPG